MHHINNERCTRVGRANIIEDIKIVLKKAVEAKRDLELSLQVLESSLEQLFEDFEEKEESIM